MWSTCQCGVGDVGDSLAVISKAKRAFGYEPSYTLEQGIQEMVERLKGKKAT